LSKLYAYPIGWNTVHYDTRVSYKTSLAFVIGLAASMLVTAFVNWYWVLSSDPKPLSTFSKGGSLHGNLHGNTTSNFKYGELISQ